MLIIHKNQMYDKLIKLVLKVKGVTLPMKTGKFLIIICSHQKWHRYMPLEMVLRQRINKLKNRSENNPKQEETNRRQLEGIEILFGDV